MRYTSVLVLMLLCGVAIGQQFVGIKGGITINNAPYIRPPFQQAQVSGKIAYLCGFKAGYDFKKIQVGAGFDYGIYKYAETSSLGTGVAAVPYSYPHVFANYKIKLKKGNLYAGLNTGYAICGEVKGWDKADPGNKMKLGKYDNGITGGVQVGYNRPVTKRLSLQAEAEARYLPIKAGFTYTDGMGNPIAEVKGKMAFTIPVTIGVTYRISGK